jgi:hypothetical protein
VRSLNRQSRNPQTNRLLWPEFVPSTKFLFSTLKSCLICLVFLGYLMSDADPFTETNATLKFLPDGAVLCLLCGKKYSKKFSALRHIKEIHQGFRRLPNGHYVPKYKWGKKLDPSSKTQLVFLRQTFDTFALNMDDISYPLHFLGFSRLSGERSLCRHECWNDVSNGWNCTLFALWQKVQWKVWKNQCNSTF